jgi:hypothetical protein
MGPDRSKGNLVSLGLGTLRLIQMPIQAGELLVRPTAFIVHSIRQYKIIVVLALGKVQTQKSTAGDSKNRDQNSVNIVHKATPLSVKCTHDSVGVKSDYCEGAVDSISSPSVFAEDQKITLPFRSPQDTAFHHSFCRGVLPP